MAYIIDQTSGDIVVGGFEKGIGDSPYTGLTDMKSVNPLSVQGEASVAFSSAPVFNCANITNGTGNIVTNGGGAFEALISLGLEGRQVITFSNIGTAVGVGLWINTPYSLVYAGYYNGNYLGYQLYTLANVLVTVSVAGTATFSTVSPTLPKYFSKSKSYNFMLDSSGRVWWDGLRTNGGGGGWIPSTNSWTWMGNTLNARSNGNGMVLYTTVNSNLLDGQDEWLFVFSDGQIDYTPISTENFNVTPVWVYGWNPLTGKSGDSTYLQGTNIPAISHETIVTPDGRVNVCDANYILNFYQNIPLPGGSYVNFNPLASATIYTTTAIIPAGYASATLNAAYTGTTGFKTTNFSSGEQCQVYFTNGSTSISFNTALTKTAGTNLLTGGTYTAQWMTAIVPPTDRAQCLTFANQYLLVGGMLNIIYPWDMNPADNTYSTPLILLQENNIQKMVTIGTNTYVFAGNRGNIYITNGSQASLFKKVPDHISGSVEPLFSWGGATYNKTRLYFGVNVSPQYGTNVAKYGGIWCVDVNSGVLTQIERMSYGTYQGYVSAIAIPQTSTAGGVTYGLNYGYGLIAGWYDGQQTYGVDVSTGVPYTTNGASYIVSDMIPVGTALNPTTALQAEFKLSTPLVAGESIQLLVGYSLYDYINDSFTDIGTTIGTAAPYTTPDGNNPPVISINLPFTIQQQQWMILKVILTSTTSNPSFDRLTEFRVIGGTVKDNNSTAAYQTK